MHKYLKIFGIAIATLIVVLLLVVQFLGGSISQGVITALNNSLNTEIKAGKVSTSLISSFPNLSVDLEDFTMLGSDNTPLIEAKRMSCQIQISSLFGRPHIKRIVISDGALQIMVDQDGNTNYHLLEYKPLDETLAEQKTTTEPATFAIDDARLEDIELVYVNHQLGIEAAALLYDANFKGDFGKEVYDMETSSNAQIQFIDNGTQRLLAGQSLRIGAKTTINNLKEHYDFKSLYLGIGGLNMQAGGTMQRASNGWDTDLNFESEQSTLTDLLLLLPQEYRDYTKDLSSRGKFSLLGNISKRWTDKQQPEMLFKISFEDGRISSPRMDIDARDLNFTGEFTNGARRIPASSAFMIEELTGKFARQPFTLKLGVENFEDPVIKFKLDGKIPGEVIPGLLPAGLLTDGDGEINVEQLSVEGRYEDMFSPRTISRVKTTGRFVADEVAMSFNEKNIELTSGNLTLDNNQFTVNDLRVRSEGNDLTFTGEATNLIPVLFADSLNSNDAHLKFRSLLTATSLDIDELMEFIGPTETEEKAAEKQGTANDLAKKSVAQKVNIVDLLEGQFDAKIERWNYGKIEGENFIGQLDFADNKMSLQGQTNAMNGRFVIDGDVMITENPRLEAKIKAQSLDAEMFFEQSNNFGQDVLTSENLVGDLNSKIYLRAYFDAAGELDYEKLLVLAELDIRDGALNDFEMLENFSAVLKARDLAKVRFTNLRNYFEISDQTLHIPVMFIQSSAMNMTLSGSHTFSQDMDYNIKVNAGQVLANKIARHDATLKPLPARRNGFFNLYYTIKGNLENYKIKSNKREVKRDFERSELHKNRIRRALESQFKESIENVEEPVDWRDEG